jgi:hypothetical protein
MIIDSFGDVIAECTKLAEEVATAVCSPKKLRQASGSRYLDARRPVLYREINGMVHTSELKVNWSENAAANSN